MKKESLAYEKLITLALTIFMKQLWNNEIFQFAIGAYFVQ